MSFHFCAHSWEVRDIDGGTLVKLSSRDLDSATLPVLVDELIELVRESGQADLYLDFADLRRLDSEVMDKLTALDARVHELGGRLILLHVKPMIYETMRGAGITDLLDIRMEESGETIF